MMGWVDIETTGLNPDTDRILEIALAVTQDNLDIVGAKSWIIMPHFGFNPDEWDPVVQEMHTKSGLIEEVRLASHTHFEVQRLALNFLNETAGIKAGMVPMCGSSVHFDRGFLKLHMPELETWFHYRNIDTSTLKELVKRWKPETGRYKSPMPKEHRALGDVYESIREMAYYKTWLFGHSAPQYAAFVTNSSSSGANPTLRTPTA